MTCARWRRTRHAAFLLSCLIPMAVPTLAFAQPESARVDMGRLVDEFRSAFHNNFGYLARPGKSLERGLAECAMELGRERLLVESSPAGIDLELAMARKKRLEDEVELLKRLLVWRERDELSVTKSAIELADQTAEELALPLDRSEGSPYGLVPPEEKSGKKFEDITPIVGRKLRHVPGWPLKELKPPIRY